MRYQERAEKASRHLRFGGEGKKTKVMGGPVDAKRKNRLK